MKKLVIYRYLGTNGVVETPVHIEDTFYTRLLQLTADEDKVLVKDGIERDNVTIPEDDFENWKEIPKGQE